MSYRTEWDAKPDNALTELSERERDIIARQLGVKARGDGTTHKGLIDQQFVRGVASFVDYSGVVELVHQQRARERARAGKGPGGRPPVYKNAERAVIALHLILDRLGRAPQVEEMKTLVLDELSPDSLTVLGLPVTDNRATKRAVYERLRRAWKRVTSTVESRPGTPQQRLRRTEIEEIIASRDTDLCAERQELLDYITHRLLEASWQILPPEIRKRWTGNIAFDATPVFVWGGGHATDPKKAKPDDSMSPEFDAGWYLVKKQGREALRWSWSLHLAVPVPDPYCDDQFPIIALGARMDTPNKRAGENAVVVARSIAQRGHPVGYFVSDRGYFGHALYNNFNEPLKALGYGVVGDYKTEGSQSQLGVQGQQNGAVQVGGVFLCPFTSEDLLTIDAMPDRVANWEKYQEEKMRQMAYAFHRKDGNQFYCPAMGPGATARCTARPEGPLSLGMPGIGKPQSVEPTVVIDPDVPHEELPACCTGGSIALNPDKNDAAKLLQDLPFRSQKWEDVWDLRGRVEHYNDYAKDPKHSDIESAHNRRVRGFGANALTLAFQLVATNLRKIEAFLKGELDEWEPARTRPLRNRFTRKPSWAREPKEADRTAPTRGDPLPIAA